MNRTLLAAPSAAPRGGTPGEVRGSSLVAGAWVQIPPPQPGVFQVRPLPFEATASYIERLSHAYQLTSAQLLDGCSITLHGHGTSPAAELDLSPTAARRVAAVARIGPDALGHALPRLTDHTPDSPATAYWKPLDALHRPVTACTLCTWQHSRGATGAAWVHRPWHRLICVRHQQATPTRGSTPPYTLALCLNSLPRTTPTSDYSGIQGARVDGWRHARSPPAGTATNNT